MVKKKTTYSNIYPLTGVIKKPNNRYGELDPGLEFYIGATNGVYLELRPVDPIVNMEGLDESLKVHVTKEILDFAFKKTVKMEKVTKNVNDIIHDLILCFEKNAVRDPEIDIYSNDRLLKDVLNVLVEHKLID